MSEIGGGGKLGRGGRRETSNTREMNSPFERIRFERTIKTIARDEGLGSLALSLLSSLSLSLSAFRRDRECLPLQYFFSARSRTL